MPLRQSPGPRKCTFKPSRETSISSIISRFSIVVRALWTVRTLCRSAISSAPASVVRRMGGPFRPLSGRNGTRHLRRSASDVGTWSICHLSSSLSASTRTESDSLASMRTLCFAIFFFFWDLTPCFLPQAFSPVPPASAWDRRSDCVLAHEPKKQASRSALGPHEYQACTDGARVRFGFDKFYYF